MGLGFDRRAAQILKQVVVRVNAVERRIGGMRLVQVAEKVVDEMRQRFGNGHGSHNANQGTDWTRT
jgi:ATP-dependent protease HslVU (ClpYQ) ATPase subunit